ncbi:MAG: hemin uptake protein HemP [Halothiobacillaceae bacterium]|jgi:hemin uptake protein HemP|nr:hemin uptake protein HemP [Halothiobacillaceae bacterium]MDY0050737.1 hemin uptake protein HemP [Halothiobacillaceae bacterium]
MSNERTHQKRPSRHLAASTPPVGRPRLDVAKLMGGRHDVVLVHGTEEYILRITSNGKLILTK